MPVYRQNIVFEVARGVRAFLNLEAGLTRGVVPGPAARRLRERGAGSGALEPENIVWIFGTARTGSTWLAHMMNGLDNHRMWNEPHVGNLFGEFHNVRAAHKRGRDSLLGDHVEDRARLIRSFVLMAAGHSFPGITSEDYLVIKEPNGAIGASLMLEALPESRMIFLIRDPRDVVSSNLGATGEEGWFREGWKRRGGKSSDLPRTPDEIVSAAANRYRNSIERSRQAHEAHGGPKVLVKYEDLRADTPGAMKRIYSTLGIPVDEEELARAVAKHSWENIPEEEKGPGKRNRKATPGGWREDLTPEQVKVVEKITGPLLQEFYPNEDVEASN